MKKVMFRELKADEIEVKCENCDYRKLLAAVFDVHILEDDCWIEECEIGKGDEE